jgi:branched-subunit amino acid transport protein AzlD
MGAVILLCRAVPFIFFSEKSLQKESLLNFLEKIVPPAAMTVLALNSLGGAFLENKITGLLTLASSVFTALLHLWKRNSLVSIFGGTALYMILIKIIPIVV